MADLNTLVGEIEQRASERLAMLGNPKLLEQSEKVERLKQRARDIGLDDELFAPRESAFSKVLNTIDKPKQVVQGVLDSAFIRQDIGEIGLLGAANRGLEERSNAFDILRRETDLHPVARGALGFGAEILTDPLTFVSFGAGTAAKAGGRTFSKQGAKLLDDISPAVMDDAARKGLGTLDVLKAPDNFAQKLAKFKEGRDELIEFGMREGTENYSLLDTAKNTHLGELKDELARYLEPEQLENLDKYFAKSKVNLGVTVPFAGHLDNVDKEIVKSLDASPGIKQSLFEAAGNAIKPKRFQKEIVIPEKIARNFDSFKTVFSAKTKQANELLETAIKNGLETPGAKIPASLASGVKGAVEGVGEIFSKSFFGAGSRLDRHFREQLINEQAGAYYKADSVLNETFLDLADEFGPEDIKNLPNKGARYATLPDKQELFSEVGREIDEIGKTSLRKFIDEIEDAGTRENFANYLNEVRTNPNTPVPRMNFGTFEENFLEGLARIAEDPSKSPEFKKLVRRTITAFDVQRAKELEAGVTSGFVEAYIPHVYTNLDDVGGKFRTGVKTQDFQRARKFSDLTEAEIEQGLVANTNVAELLYERAAKGHRAIAKANYMRRMLVEHGLPTTVVENLYQEAAELGPDSSAAKMLKANNLNIPSYHGDKTTRKLLERSIERVKRGVERTGAKPDLSLFKNKKIRKFLEDAEEQLGRDDLTGLLLNSTQEGLDLIEGLTKGGRPPRLAFGEMGARLIDDGFGNEMFVPEDVAKAIDEATQRKDLLKNLFGDSELGKSALEASDGVTSMFKRLVTIPFPSYWSQNLLGDHFLRAADGGIMALSPDLTARTMGLLNGSHTVKLKNGVVLDGKAFKELLGNYGVDLDIRDVIDINKSLGSFNLEAIAKRQKGVLKNLRPGRGFDASSALDNAGNVMREKFENFFRAQHVLHHMERGSSAIEAVNNAQRSLINYRALTDVEKSVFRRFFFFYGWINGSTRNTLHNLIFNPGALQGQIKTARAIAEGFSEQDALPSIEQHDKKVLNSLTSKEQVSFSLGKDEEGKPLIGRGFGLPLNTLLSQFSVQVPRSLSAEEVIGASFDSFSRTMQKQFASANPIISGVAERVTGRNLYFDRPWDEQFLRKVPSMEAIAKRIAGKSHDAIPMDLIDDEFTRDWLGGVPDGKGNYVVDPGKFWVLTHLVPGLSRVISTARGFSDERLSDSQALLKALSGVRVETADPGRNLLFEEERNLRSLLKKKSENLRKNQGQRALRDSLRESFN